MSVLSLSQGSTFGASRSFSGVSFGLEAASTPTAYSKALLVRITGKQGQDALRTNNAFEYAVGVDAASNPKLTPLNSEQT
jgi:iron(III) transport system substrate-binding protein